MEEWAASLSRGGGGAIVEPMGVQADIPRRHGGGALYPTPCGCVGACGGPDHRPALGNRSEARRGEGCYPASNTHGGA
jgi:hypothetical protein